jgi:hypothetical protein
MKNYYLDKAEGKIDLPWFSFKDMNITCTVTVSCPPTKKPTMKNYFLERAAVKEPEDWAPAESTWDFQTALGDTIREKYENEYVKVIEIKSI